MSKQKKGNSKMTRKPKGLLGSVIIWIAMGVGLGFVGYLTGYLIKAIEKSGINFNGIIDSEKFYNNTCCAMPFIFAGILIVAGGISYMYLLKAKKGFNSWDGEDEDSIHNVEQMISKSLIVSNTAIILEIFLLSIAIFFFESTKITLNENVLGICAGLTTAFLVVGIICYVAIQRGCVELEKKINPEKKGEVLDINFNKDWEESCDEAEIIMIGKAAYKSFKVVNFTCVLLWLIAFVAQFAFKTGIFPVLLVSIIWAVLTLSYQIEAYKLDNKK
ncbi:MAG: DUF3169 family protein [Acutalibacteraceae bacterium]|nr:DUF3169 family protein [Acutalibacteraceae bacterium]